MYKEDGLQEVFKYAMYEYFLVLYNVHSGVDSIESDEGGS